MKRQLPSSSSGDERALKRTRHASVVDPGLFDALLVDDMIGELARHLVSPYDYWALARVSPRAWRLLGQRPQPRLYMERRYFQSWRTIVTLGNYSLLAAADVVQTPELCIAAAQRNGYALAYVKEQTPELCLVAVQQNGDALYYVKVQTPELRLAAVQQKGNALEHTNVQTPELCLAAVQQNGWALAYVKEQTPALCLAAVLQNADALRYVKMPTPELCLAARHADSHS